MKKLILFAVLIFLHSLSFGQVSAYTFAYSVGTYTPLASGTPVVPPNSGFAGNGWFEQVVNIPLPFVYYFKGAGYSSVYVNSNGHIAFDKPTYATNQRPNTVYSAPTAGTIMGYGCTVTYAYNNPPVTGSAGTALLGGLIDNANANPIIYSTIGSAPNRIFVVQWTNAYRSLTYFGASAGYAEGITFQIRLKETSNVAEIVYNTSTTAYESSPYYPSVGLTSVSTSDVNLVTGTSFSSVTNTTASATANIIFNPSNGIAAGTTFTFTPNAGQMPTACSGTPAVTPTALSNASIASGGSVTLSLAGLPLSTGLTYQWQSSSTGLPNSFSNISGGTNETYVASPSATTYYICQVACGAGTPVSSTIVAVGYQSSYPGVPYTNYNSTNYPANVGILTISGSCSTTLSDATNNNGSYNYPTFNGTSGTCYAYADYTSIMPRVKLEGSTSLVNSYNVTVNNSVYSTAYGVWIDFNDNGSFADAGENVGSVTGVAQAAKTFAILIPVNSFGIHRMRVRANLLSPVNPTGSMSNPGQTIDYAVEITPPLPTATNNGPLCSTGTLTLTSAAITGATYMWSGPSGYTATTLLPNQNYVVPSTAASGTYSLMTVVKGVPACAGSGTTAVTVKPQPSLSNATDNGPVCTDNTLSLFANSPFSVAGYSWAGPVSITTPTSSTATVPNVQMSGAGTYTVTVNNGPGSNCTASYTTTPIINQSPNISSFSVPSATNPCVGFASTVTVNSSSLAAGTYFVIYDVSGANVATGLSATLVIAAGTGTFVTSALVSAGATTITINSITNALSCSKTLSSGNTVNLTVNPQPSAITGTSTVCEGNTTSLTDAGGGTWLSSSPTNATVSGTGLVNGLLAGTANITYTLPTGCLTTRAVTINVSPAAITGTFTVCKGLVTTLANTTTPGTWTSSNSALASVNSTGDVTGVVASAPNITYTGSNGCYVTVVVTVNPLPVAISGKMDVCTGLTTTLSDATPFGLWTSGTSSVATIVSGSGVLSGLIAGTADITYTLPTGCLTTSAVTVNPLPAPISGTMTVCEGLTTTLSDVDVPGTWSTGTTTIFINVGSGLVTALIAGNPVVTYTLPTGCTATATLTVNPLPAAITGTAKVCEGLSVNLNNATPSGTWMSDNIVVATVPPTAGAVSGILAGTANITYTLPTGCIATKQVTVNPLPAAITGTTDVCVGLTTGLNDVTALGTWSSSDPSSATINSSGLVTGVNPGAPVITYKLPTGCINTVVVTVNPVPASITGVMTVCEGLVTALSNATPSGTWSSGSPNATVLSGSGNVTGVTAGTADITYMLSTGCIATANVLVNQSPAAIGGTLNVCKGLQTALGNTIPGGTWYSSNTNSSIVPASGLLTGMSAGTSIITYMLGAGCKATAVATVNALPAAITGSKIVCEGLTTTLGNTSTPGSWTSSNTTAASVVAGTGVVTGLLTGTSAVTYTLSTGCIASVVVTVNPSPAPILGVMQVCKGLATPLSDAVSGGTWSSSNTGMATVSGTGVVTGVAAGAPVITYQLPKGCFYTTVVTVDPLPAAITGTKQICQDFSVTLKDVTTPGIWSSSNTTVIVGAGTGLITGTAVGTAMVTYMLGTGCITTTQVTVNPMPAPITGLGAVCSGSSITLANTVAPGVWSSKSIATVAVDAGTGAVTGITPGVAAITYTLPAGCAVTKNITVNALPAPHSMAGGGSFCMLDTGVHVSLSGSDTGINYELYRSGTLLTTTLGNTLSIDYGLMTTGGAYTVVATNRNTGCSNNMPGTAVVTVIPIPSPIIGKSTVCVADNITLSHLSKGGTWTSSDPSLATIDASTGVVKGVTTGVLDITYTVLAGCKVAAPLAVIPLPEPIMGTPVVCAGSSTTLTDPTSGGTWSSSIPGFAAVGPISGVMTGIFRGNCIITYTATNGCTALATATVNPLPDAVSGDASVCVGATAYLSDAYAGGTWKSGSNAIATVTTTSTLGTMTGVAAGTTTMTYTLPTGCLTTGVITVDPQPKAGTVSGPSEVCQNKSITLVDTTKGGSWHSKLGLVNVTDAGVVTGAFGGKDTVLYSVTNVCGTASAKYPVTVNICDFTAVDNVVNVAGEMKVYPNPNDGVFTVNLLSDVTESATIVITNIVGQEVKEVTTVTNKPLGIQLDMAAGVYMLTGFTAHGTYTAKVTVTR